EVVSPINGKVDNIFPTKHAIELQADHGHELLVHVGLDTVQLDGEGFELLVESGDTVNIGDLLLRFDLNYINENANSVISPVIITKSDNTSSIAVAEDINSLAKGETKIVDVTMN